MSGGLVAFGDPPRCGRAGAGVVSMVIGRWTVEEFFAGTRPPTDDEVPTTLDGIALDTPAKVIEYLERINAERERISGRPT